jgi:hypothetical protein
MSLRAIAIEVYKCQSKVHKLQDQLEAADSSELTELQEQLRQALAELKILKNMIEGRKAQSSNNLKTSPFRFGR